MEWQGQLLTAGGDREREVRNRNVRAEEVSGFGERLCAQDSAEEGATEAATGRRSTFCSSVTQFLQATGKDTAVCSLFSSDDPSEQMRGVSFGIPAT